jgi:hypothetical protein
MLFSFQENIFAVFEFPKHHLAVHKVARSKQRQQPTLRWEDLGANELSCSSYFMLSAGRPVFEWITIIKTGCVQISTATQQLPYFAWARLSIHTKRKK